MLFASLSILYAFLMGLVIGSFLNAYEYRLAHGTSIARDRSGKAARSRCPHCGHMLAATELIPVFSYILLGGKCKSCKKSISLQYPLVELATAFVCAIAVWHFGASSAGIVASLYGSILVFIFLYDLKHQLILDRVTVPAIVVAAILSLTVLQYSLWAIVLGSAIGGGFFLLQYVISRGTWIGGGDIRLGVLMGCMLGWQQTVLALILAYIVGAITGVILIASRKMNRKSHLAFGTFLSAATFISLLWGNALIEWYIDFLV